MSLVAALQHARLPVLAAEAADKATVIRVNTAKATALITDILRRSSMDGPKLARLVGQTHPDMRLVLTSGYLKTPKNDVPGIVGLISKPYEIGIVVNHIRELTFCWPQIDCHVRAFDP